MAARPGKACAKCHVFEGEGDVGLPIAGNGTPRIAALRDIVVLEGQNTPTSTGMPPVGKGWVTVQLDLLMAYIRSNQILREGPADGGLQRDTLAPTWKEGQPLAG